MIKPHAIKLLKGIVDYKVQLEQLIMEADKVAAAIHETNNREYALNGIEDVLKRREEELKIGQERIDAQERDGKLALESLDNRELAVNKSEFILNKKKEEVDAKLKKLDSKLVLVEELSRREEKINKQKKEVEAMFDQLQKERAVFAQEKKVLVEKSEMLEKLKKKLEAKQIRLNKLLNV